MKKLLSVLMFAAIVSCSPAMNRRVANTALDVATVLCVIANAEVDEPKVQHICNIADALMPDVQKLIGEQKAAARRYASTAGSSADAGCK